MFVSRRVKQLSHLLAVTAGIEDSYFPIDREFLNPYLSQIDSLNPVEFIYWNLESVNPTYVTNLFICLPEIWEKVDIDDINFIMSKFTNDFSYFTLIQFTYKYLDIDILQMIFHHSKVNGVIEQVKEYLLLQWNNIIRTPADSQQLEFGIGREFFSYDIAQWNYIKQKLMLDQRVTPTIEDLNQFEIYIRNLTA